jgi:hypothetical protein
MTCYRALVCVTITGLGVGFTGLGAGGAWDDWECPGFPCFITNKNDPAATTPGRQETCGPISELDLCQDFASGTSFDNHTLVKPHPCSFSKYWVCDQTSCLQGTQAACKQSCGSLLDYYKPMCEGACERYCPS